MPLNKIVRDENILSRSSDDINIEENKELIDKIIQELKDNIEGRSLLALSAPQIGYPYRIFCVKYKGQGTKIAPTISTYINPIITKETDVCLSRENDVCLPHKTFINLRYNQIQMMYQNEEGESLTNDFVGKTAQVIQMMVDHLDGVLISDVGLEIDADFDKATEEEKNEILAAYMNALKEYKKALDKEIEETPDLKEMKDAVDFMQSVKKGETQLGDRIGITETGEIVEGF